MRLLLVASDPMEFRGVLARAGEVRSAELAVDWARLARLGGNESLLVANGVGWKRAGAAADLGCQAFSPDRVVNTGFCGALDPDLPLYRVVVASSVAAPDRRYAAQPAAGGVPHLTGVVSSYPRVVRTAEEKRMLRLSGAIAVEMEAAAVAGSAEIRGLPFHCVRAVTDLAGETLANDFNAALRPDGHFDTILVLGAALRNPLVRLPELFRLQRRCARAARVLGEFFADCRF